MIDPMRSLLQTFCDLGGDVNVLIRDVNAPTVEPLSTDEEAFFKKYEEDLKS